MQIQVYCQSTPQRSVEMQRALYDVLMLALVMACDFKIPFTGSADDVLSKARNAVQSQGGNFSGDAATGNFDVSAFGNTIKGSYTVAGSDLNILIDSKPFFLPCSTIEGFLKSQLGL